MSHKKLKILFYNTDLRGGGAEKILVNIANDLHQRGYDVTVGTFFEEGVNRQDLLPGIRQFSAMKKPFKGYSKLALFFSPKFLYQKYIRPHGDFDVNIAFLEGFPSRILSGAPKHQKSVSWIHLELYADTIGKEFRSVAEAKQAYAKFNKIIYVAGTVKECFEKCIPVSEGQAQVIYNPLQVSEIIEKSLQPQEFSYPEDGILNLVTVGRLNPQKGYDRLLNIMKKLKDDGLVFRV